MRKQHNKNIKRLKTITNPDALLSFLIDPELPYEVFAAAISNPIVTMPMLVQALPVHNKAENWSHSRRVFLHPVYKDVLKRRYEHEVKVNTYNAATDGVVE